MPSVEDNELHLGRECIGGDRIVDTVVDVLALAVYEFVNFELEGVVMSRLIPTDH